MQRKQIKVGDVLYWQQPGDWNRVGTWEVARVTVVAVEPHRKNHTGEFVPGKPFRNGSADLLVDFEARSNGGSGFHKARRTLVRPADLRGPWEATLAARLDAEKADQAARNEARARREAIEAAVEAAVERARTGGFRSATNDTPYSYRDRPEWAKVSVSLADLTRMLDTIDQLKAQVEADAATVQQAIGERDAEGE